MNDMRHGMRNVLHGIENELDRVNRQLAGYDDLLAERSRLLAARAALTGAQARASKGSGRRRVSQDEIAAYLADHPESRPAQIATALGVPVTNVSAHLSRGKDTRFLRGGSGWRLNRHTG
jgi:hypothetical protein